MLIIVEHNKFPCFQVECTNFSDSLTSNYSTKALLVK